MIKRILIKTVIRISDDNRVIINHNGIEQPVNMGKSNIDKDLSYLVGENIEVLSAFNDAENGALVFPCYLGVYESPYLKVSKNKRKN